MDHILKKIKTILKQDFSILASSGNRWILILFCAIFATFFLIFYNPLDVASYKINTYIGSLISVKSAGVVGALVLVFTQFGLKKIWRIQRQTLGQFLLWFILEIFMISIVIYLFFGERGLPILPEYLLTFEKTIALSLIPYSLACLIIALIHYRQDAGQMAIKTGPVAFITLSDENGKGILSLKSSDLIYLKSEDNYVRVTYLRNGAVEQKLIRNNLKSISTELNNPNIVRIHRSYMVNKPNINTVSREGRKIVIQMNHLRNQPLTVSSSYKSKVESFLSS